jgi:hypothetical protein
VARLLERLREERINSQGNPFAGADGREKEVGPLLSALFSAWPPDSAVRLVECTSTLVEMCPTASEHFSGVDETKLGSLRQLVQRNVCSLLRGGFDESRGSAREQRFAGIRAVVRSISSEHTWLLVAEVAVALAIAMDSPVGHLSAYATWALAEWARKGVTASDSEVLRIVVVPALRRAARDRRLGVAVNGVRGLFAINRERPDWVAADEFAEFRLDPRIAVQRVFDGLASASAFASVL